MAMDSTWESLQQGSSWKLVFAITCSGESEQVTEEYEINDLAMVRFKWKSVKHGHDGQELKIICSFSTKKHDQAKDSAIEIAMNCDTLKYFTKQFFCNESWSDWEVMGQIKPFLFKGDIYYDTLTVNFTAWRVDRDRFSKLYQDTVFTDFSISTPEGSVAVHKACLATYSDVFKTMLCGSWKETTEGEIKMEGVTLQTLKHLKEYMYLGTIPDGAGLRPLLLIAKRYLMEDLEEQCIRKLALTATPKNLYSLIEFACENNIPELAFAITRLTKDPVIFRAHEIREKRSIPKTDDENARV